MLNNPPLLIITLGAGLILGLFYFGGLWLTVRRLDQTQRPIVSFWVSYGLRLGTVLGVFHLILQWARSDQLLVILLVCFLGFLMARTLFISRILPRDQREARSRSSRRTYGDIP